VVAVSIDAEEDRLAGLRMGACHEFRVSQR
jgi:hypothetical protein